MARADEQSAVPGGQDIADRRDGGDQRQAFRAPGDRPRPYSYGDLSQRLERLPRGHPSSPYNANGSRKPPPPRLRDLELPLPGEEPGDPDGYDEPESAPDRPGARADAEDSEPGERGRLVPDAEPGQARRVAADQGETEP